MEEFVPAYYHKFKCIAGNCRHNCCLDWEVDVDDKTFEYYKTVKTDFGKKLTQNMYKDQNGVHIMLDKSGRCPFLNQENLCDIIINLGEDALCGICTDHPRFRNYFSQRVEVGIGMCCEEAARIILSWDNDFGLVSHGELSKCSDEEELMLKKRNIAFAIVSDKTKTFSERMRRLCDEFCLDFYGMYNYDWKEILFNLECLDESWHEVLNMINDNEPDEKFFENDFWNRIFENLTTYYIYRHFSKSSEGNEKTCMAFSVFGYTVIKKICYSHYCMYDDIEFEDIVNYCRMFSSELEYCPENMDELFLEFEFVI